MKRDQIFVENVPEDVRAAVEVQAKEEDANRNDVVCRILATRFRATHEGTGYPYRPGSAGVDSLYLRTSGNVLAAVRAAAEESSAPGRQIAASRLIIATLQAHYGLPVDSPRRRGATSKLTPEEVREARARYEAGESLRSLSERYDIARPSLTRAIRATN